MLKLVPIQVQCYSGHKGAERPVSFEEGGRTCSIEEIIDRWYGPSEAYFKVRCKTNEIFLLKHDQRIDKWFLEVADPNIQITQDEDPDRTAH